ncbi:hypothetical protein INT44_007488, partial [Umbelopsis vinacea]
MNYMESVTFSLQTGIFFLLQCFWSYLSSSVAKHSFMGSWEFKTNVAWCVISIALFPVLQWAFRDDLTKSEIVPELAYGIEALVIALFGIRSHFRFRALISKTHNATNGKAIVTKLTYFMEMNVRLTDIYPKQLDDDHPVSVRIFVYHFVRRRLAYQQCQHLHSILVVVICKFRDLELKSD